MKVPAHLVGLYHRTLRRYKKLTVRLKREADPNGFSYRSLVQKLRKLRRKLSDLHVQLKIATATGALVAGLACSSQAQTTHNGPFVRQPRHVNPLREPFKFYDVTFPAVVDLDKDGDFDMVVADENNYQYDYGGNSSIGPMRYFVNIGSNADPVYEEKFDTENPFFDLDIDNRYRGPVFADIDKDGDQDLFVGVRDYGYSGNASGVLYFRNDNGNFVQQTGAWNPATKAGNPFSLIQTQGNYKLAFADVDKDNDLDAVVGGTVIDGATGSVLRYISYYKNDGNGTFTDASNELTLTPAPNEWWLNPALADVDKDGDVDLLLGGYYFGLRYYRQISPGNFVEETGEYNPATKTGNPFDGIYFPNTQPVFADIDGDADVDLMLGEGDGDHYYPYPANIIHYYVNEGNGVYKEQPDLENPMGGVNLRRDASPVFADLDSDGDLDALIGHKYDYYYNEDPNTPRHYEFDNGVFKRREYEDSEFGSIDIAGNITPTLADIDGDGDLDFISGTYFGQIVLYRNNNGEYVLDNTNLFDDIDFAYLTSPEFADMDGDGDLDMFVGARNHLQIHYYENVGTAQAPAFEEKTGDENPLDLVSQGEFAKGYFDLVDVDHDGDIDAVVVAYSSFKYYEFNVILYYENTGTPALPSFQLGEEEQPFFDPQNPFGMGRELQPNLADQDGDGDLDLFVGEYYGTIRYIRNENPAVVTSVSTGALTYDIETGGDLVVDPTLTLSDEDDDLVVRATVTIGNYQVGDELHFVSQPGIAGDFNAGTGVLTLSGKATRAVYQTLLQTVTYHHHADEAGRTKRNLETVAKSIGFRVFDTDFTTPEVAARVVNAVFADTDSGEIQVFNAIAPNSTGDNKFMRIVNLPERNLVTIYSRWGDKVFEIDDYDSATPGKRFEGKNDGGKPLGTGTYFYKIEIPDTPGYSGPRSVTGYLTLKQ